MLTALLNRYLNNYFFVYINIFKKLVSVLQKAFKLCLEVNFLKIA